MSGQVLHYPLDTVNHESLVGKKIPTNFKEYRTELDNCNRNPRNRLLDISPESRQLFKEKAPDQHYERTEGHPTEKKHLFPYKSILFVFKRIEEWIELYNRWMIFGQMWNLQSTEEILEAIVDNSLALPFRVKVPTNLGQSNVQNFSKTIVLTFLNDDHYFRFNSKWISFRERFAAYDNTMSFALSMDMILGIIPQHFLVLLSEDPPSYHDVLQNECCEDQNYKKDGSGSEEIVLDLSNRSKESGSQAKQVEPVSEDSSDTIIVDQSCQSESELVIDLSFRPSDESTKADVEHSSTEEAISNSDVVHSNPLSEAPRVRRRKSPPQKKRRLSYHREVELDQTLLKNSYHDQNSSFVNEVDFEPLDAKELVINRVDNPSWSEVSSSEHKELVQDQTGQKEEVVHTKLQRVDYYDSSDNYFNGSKTPEFSVSEQAILAVMNNSKSYLNKDPFKPEAPNQLKSPWATSTVSHTDLPIENPLNTTLNKLQSNVQSSENMLAPFRISTTESDLTRDIQPREQDTNHTISSAEQTAHLNSQVEGSTFDMARQSPTSKRYSPESAFGSDYSDSASKSLSTELSCSRFDQLLDQPEPSQRSKVESLSPSLNASNSLDAANQFYTVSFAPEAQKKVDNSESPSGSGFQAKLSEFLVGDLEVVSQLATTIETHKNKNCTSPLNIHSVCFKKTWIEFYLVCNRTHAYQINFFFKMVENNCYVFA